MKKLQVLTIAVAAILVAFANANAMDKKHSGMDHSKMSGETKMEGHGEMKGHGGMDHSGHMGEGIRDAKVDGYEIAYHLIDMKEKMKGQKMPDDYKATHHLMVYAVSPMGHNVDKAKVGFIVSGPGGKQKVMAMGMKGGFGGDLDLSQKGDYKITAKIKDGEKVVMDKFTYTVE